MVNLPDIPLFTSRPIHLGKDEIPDAVWLDFYAACEKQHISFGYPVGFTINQENLRPGRTHVVSQLWFHSVSYTHLDDNDFFYMRNKGECLAYRGGYWNNALRAGVFYLNGSNARSSLNISTGFRSAYIPELA